MVSLQFVSTFILKCGKLFSFSFKKRNHILFSYSSLRKGKKNQHVTFNICYEGKDKKALSIILSSTCSMPGADSHQQSHLHRC